VNAWLLAATVLLLGLVPLGLTSVRGGPLDGVVALQLGGTVVSLVLLLLAAAFERSSYLVLPAVAPVVGFAGTLAFLRLLERLE
jgi:multicomponent Na+:H+ antiporter subunit F